MTTLHWYIRYITDMVHPFSQVLRNWEFFVQHTVKFLFHAVLFFAQEVFTKTNPSQGKLVSVDDRKWWVRGASVLLIRGYNTCVLWAPISSDLQILFFFLIDIWRTTVCTPNELRVQMRGECTSPPTAPTQCVWMKKTHFFPCPNHLHIELLQTFPLGFLVKVLLHCPTKTHGVQSRNFSIWFLICSILLLSLFLLLSSVPFNFLTSPWYSFYCVYCLSLFHFCLGFFPLYVSFPWEKGCVPL